MLRVSRFQRLGSIVAVILGLLLPREVAGQG